MRTSSSNNGHHPGIFITGEQTIRQSQSPAVVEHRCAFLPGSYGDALFQSLAVDFPAALDRSVNKRKAEFLAGRWCARQALIALGMEPVVVATGQRGEPLWPPGITGSISHCRTQAAAVVSSDPAIRGLGIDIESLVDEVTLARIRDRVLIQEELPLLEGDTLDPRRVFTLIFAAKEAFYKAANPLVRDYFDFDAVTVSAIDTETGTLFFRLNYRLHPTLLRGASFQAHFEWINADTVSVLVWLG